MCYPLPGLCHLNPAFPRFMAGWYMFQFHRILQYAQPPSGSQQPFFWLFVDNLLLTEDDQATATRFFQVGISGG